MLPGRWSNSHWDCWGWLGDRTVGLLLSLLLVKETHAHAQHESELHGRHEESDVSQTRIFLQTSLRDCDLSSITQAGFVNNLNDGTAWGLFPVFIAAAGMSLERIGWLAAIYPATWGILQLWTGHLSDSLGRKWMIAWGMWIQAVGIGITVLSGSFWWFAVGAVLLGAGTAMVYPTLLAAVGDVVHPRTRATSVGVYRLWRDAGYVAGALVSGVTADLLGVGPSIGLVAAITMLSGLVVAIRMRETLSLRRLADSR